MFGLIHINSIVVLKHRDIPSVRQQCGAPSSESPKSWACIHIAHIGMEKISHICLTYNNNNHVLLSARARKLWEVNGELLRLLNSFLFALLSIVVGTHIGYIDSRYSSMYDCLLQKECLLIRYKCFTLFSGFGWLSMWNSNRIWHLVCSFVYSIFFSLE